MNTLIIITHYFINFYQFLKGIFTINQFTSVQVLGISINI
jgi:hypothetical protein